MNKLLLTLILSLGVTGNIFSAARSSDDILKQGVRTVESALASAAILSAAVVYDIATAFTNYVHENDTPTEWGDYLNPDLANLTLHDPTAEELVFDETGLLVGFGDDDTRLTDQDSNVLALDEDLRLNTGFEEQQESEPAPGATITNSIFFDNGLIAEVHYSDGTIVRCDENNDHYPEMYK